MTTFSRAIIDPESRGVGAPLRFVLSTPGMKRDGIDLDLRFMRTENFARNPVMPWQHGMDPSRGALPVGRWRNVRVNDDGDMIGEAEFDSDDAFAVNVERKYREGFLNAVSISWQERGDSRVDWYDLLEVSAVAVPADPDALLSGRSVVLTSREYEDLTKRVDSLERMVRYERARATAIDALRSL